MEYVEPRILRSGAPISLIEEMLEQREVELVGEVDGNSVYSLCRQLRYLYREDSSRGITIYIDSPGGSVDSGLALYDTMRAITQKKQADGRPCCPIRTVCMGTAASMASIIFAAGTKGERLIMPHSEVMIHDPLIPRTGGSALKLKEISDGLMRTRKYIAELLAEFTGQDVKQILKKTQQDTYFKAQDAVEFGLADRIIDDIRMIDPF